MHNVVCECVCLVTRLHQVTLHLVEILRVSHCTVDLMFHVCCFLPDVEICLLFYRGLGKQGYQCQGQYY